jgi:8-oxo-dGTP diphosphatase
MQMAKADKSDYIRVTAAVILQAEQVLIAQRKATDRLAGLWEFPGGKIESGESPEVCLARELREELGIEVRIGHFLGETTYRYPHMAIKLMVYRAYWTGGALMPTDHARCEWVPIRKLNTFSFAPADIPFVEMLVKRPPL